MRFPLALKIGLLAVAPIVAASVIGVRVAYEESKAVLIDNREADLMDDARLRAEWVQSQIAMLREDVLALAGKNVIREFVRVRQSATRDAAGESASPTETDPADSEAELRRELERLFREICNYPETGHPKPYLQVRFLGPDGREAIRIEREESTEAGKTRIEFVPKNTTADKSGEPYFKETKEMAESPLKTAVGEVYLSEINLNRENRVAQKDNPVLRAAVPVYDDDAQFAGIVIINLDFRQIQCELSGSPRHLVYLTNDAGEFLVHPNVEKQFVWDDPDRSGGCGVRDQIEFKEVLPLFEPKYDDKTIQTMGGFKQKELEYVGYEFKQFPHPDQVAFEDEFTLAVIERTNDDSDHESWTQLGERLQVEKEHLAGFRAPPVKVIEANRTIPISARQEEDLRKIIDKLENAPEFQDTFDVKYLTNCEDFAAHFFRIYYDPRAPGKFLGLVMAFSYQESDAELLPTKRRIWLQVILLGVLVGILAVVFSLMLTGRLTKIKRASDKIANGDFDVSLPSKSNDEIGDLARGFQHMITEIQARGKDIRDREARLRMIVDSAAEGIVTAYEKFSFGSGSESMTLFPRIPVASDGGLVNRFNLAATRMFGYEEDELNGQSIRRLIAPAYHEKLEQHLRVLTEEDASRRSVMIEAVGLRKNGSEFPLELAVSSVQLDDRRMFTFIVRDITERKQSEARIQEMNDDLKRLNEELDHRVKERTAELELANNELELANKELELARDKAQELAKAKDAFLASVSHELRNPLNQVTGFCQLLELTELDEAQRGDLEKIRQAAKRLLTLINDILDYQKIIMGGITLEPEELRVEDLLSEVRDATSFLARDNGNRLEFQTGDDVGTLYTDKHRTLQILINLISNACKFTRKGSVTVNTSRHSDNGNRWIEFAVSDSGRGMTSEEQAKLFRPFSKLASKQGNKAGTGLGLVIAKGFCEMMGGAINVESEFGSGSTFLVRLPASKADRLPAELLAAPAARKTAQKYHAAPAEVPVPAPTVSDGLQAAGRQIAAATAQAGNGNRTVLVIDDDPAVREVMTRYLSQRGFHVVTAADGLQGLDLAKQRKPAAITLDAMMPGLDGWAVLAALKTDRETSSIPVIMVTISDDSDRGHKMGAAEFVNKPVDWDQLSNVLASYTGEKRDRSILVVDDDADTRDVLHRFLKRDGWNVLEAEDGEAALELLAIEQPAAIILDLVMPGMDGFEFIAQYSQLAEWLSIPVIVVSSKEPTKQELEALDGLVVRVLRKGDYSTEQLLDEIHRRVDIHIKTESAELEGA